MRILTGATPVPLGEFLETNAAALRNKRAFYIVEPLLEKDKVIKFGIAGMQSGHPYTRLNEYNIIYGTQTRANSCKGVKVHFVGVTEYDRMVSPTNTQVARLERQLKQLYKTKTEKGRGTERVAKEYLADILQTIRDSKLVDEVTVLRDTSRPNAKSQEYRKDHAAFKQAYPGIERRQTRSTWSEAP